MTLPPKLLPPILLPLAKPTPAQRWQLAESLYAQARVAVEGTIIQLSVLLVALFRTHWVAFVYIAVLACLALLIRLQVSVQFRAAFARVSFEPDRPGMPLYARREPEFWAWRFAAGVMATASLWGVADLCVMLRFDDNWLQMFTLLLQAGWVASACVRYTPSPLLVLGISGLTLGPTSLGLALGAPGAMHLILPVALLHFGSLMRSARWYGDMLVSRMDAERRVEEANAHLQRLSTTDPLTGLANRRRFDEVIQTEWLRAARNGDPVALLMIDVDHFKLFNDNYGHQAGDECLRGVAQHLLGAARRPADHVARYGGEEFAMILPQTSEADASAIAENLLGRLTAASMAHAASPLGIVTVSIGLAALIPPAGTAADLLISAADARLYEAKSAGRNRIAPPSPLEDMLIKRARPTAPSMSAVGV